MVQQGPRDGPQRHRPFGRHVGRAAEAGKQGSEDTVFPDNAPLLGRFRL
jgi:hypothetical protein